MSSVKSQIDAIFNKNAVDDLNYFLEERHNLNVYNIRMRYIFNFIQGSGGFISAYGNGTNQTNIVWIGIALVALATFIINCEKINDIILKKYLEDINLIKQEKYVDEALVPLLEQQQKVLDKEHESNV
jgi:hypothetical protein